MVLCVLWVTKNITNMKTLILVLISFTCSAQYVTKVQRQVYQDLVRFDSLKSYTGLLEFHIDSLNLEIKNLYQLVEIQDRQIREKDKEIGLRLQSEVLDQEIISIYKKEADKYRKQNRLLKILVISLPVGVLLLK